MFVVAEIVIKLLVIKKVFHFDCYFSGDLIVPTQTPYSVCSINVSTYSTAEFAQIMFLLRRNNLTKINAPNRWFARTTLCPHNPHAAHIATSSVSSDCCSNSSIGSRGSNFIHHSSTSSSSIVNVSWCNRGSNSSGSIVKAVVLILVVVILVVLAFVIMLLVII